MQSFKDKIKSKIAKSKLEQPQTMETFDENSITIQVSQIKSQLDQVRLVCSWNQKNTHKIPKLNCRWYNRAQNNLQQIQGVTDELYQPSISDVETIIQVTCMPELNGMNYEGMPILVKTNIIKLSQNTQNQANALNSKRAKFFVDLRQYKLKGKVHSQKHQGIIIIENNSFTLNQTKFGQLHDDTLLQLQINENYPIFTPNRRNKKQIKIQFNEGQYCILQTKNNEIRDVICLLIKTKVAQIIIDKELASDGKAVENKDDKNLYADIMEKKTNSQESIHKNPQNKAKHGSQENIKIQKQNDKPKALQILQMSSLKQQIHKLQQQNLKMNKQLQQQKQKSYTLQMKNVQTKQRLQNATRHYFELQKQLSAAKSTTNELHQKLKQFKNLQVNNNQELIYYKTEMKLLKEQRQNIVKQKNHQKSRRQQLQKQLEKYRQMANSHKTYEEITDQLREIRSKYQVLELKYFYSKQEKQKMEEQIKSNKVLIESIQSQKNNIEQKYLSLSYQIQNYQESQPNTPSLSKVSSKSSQTNSLRSSKIFEQSPQRERERQRESQFLMNQKLSFRHQSINSITATHQNQISSLKKQIVDLMEQKSYIKTLLLKQKKPTSRSILKLQLFEVKKLSSRLSQAIMQNQMCINKLRQINKELNNKNVTIQRENTELLAEVQQLRDIRHHQQ